MPIDNATVVEALRASIGADRVSTDPAVLENYGRDTWPLRLVQEALGRRPSRPLAVLRPRSAAEVASALRLLSAQAIPVVPRGGGSGVVGGAAAPSDAFVLDLGALDRILDLDEHDLLVRAQAGVGLASLEAWLGERGYTTGHYPQSIALAQIGGLVATRSSGQFSTKYGNIEELVAGLEVVLSDGTIARMSPAPRRAVGPDLRQLFIGSEGTLGVITEVTLKVVPLPAERRMQALALPSFVQGLESLRLCMRAGWRPALVRLHDPLEARRSYADVVAPGEAILLLLSEGPQGYASVEMAALEQIVFEQGGRSLGPEPVRAWLDHRNDINHYEQWLRSGLIVDTIEVAAGWQAIARIYERALARARAELAELKLISAHASHCYPQGTNLYFSVAAKSDPDPELAEQIYRRVWAIIMESTLAEGGTIAHHHGIGRMRTPWVRKDLGAAYVLLDRIERALDPRGVMNPGVLLD